MALLTYTPHDVSVNIAGLYDISGFSDGTFIELSKEVAPYSYSSAMDGETTRTFVNDSNYRVTLTLAQSSPSNNILNALHAVDVATQLGKFPLMIRDRSGTTNFFSPNVWIENVPNVTFGKDMDTRKWVFNCSECTLLVGGSEKNTVADILGLLPTLQGAFTS